MSYFRMDIARRTLIAALGFGLVNTGAGAAAAKNCPRERFIIFQDVSNKWRWRLCSGNGQQIAEHKQPYDSKQACRRGIETVQKYHNAPIVDEDDCGADCKKG
jgi:uncharacterized protein YegP (UPF0339 family)